MAIRAYFQNGTLPAPGTICETDTKMFEAPNNSSSSGVTISLRSEHEEEYSLRVAKDVLAKSNFLTKNLFKWVA